jgi:FkbM family methyltransferase
MMNLLTKIRELYKAHKNWRRVKKKQARFRESLQVQLAFYKQFLSEGDIVFDIGANVGDKVAVFLEAQTKVVAVEPQESCWRVLAKRFKNEKEKVVIVPSAVAEKEGTITLYIDKSTTISSTSQEWIDAVKKSGRFPSHKWADKSRVKATTLDCLIKDYGKPRFCKIDVEGAEAEVLKGLSRPIDCLSFEFVPEKIEKTIECIDRLAVIGDYRYNFCFGEAEHFELPDSISASEMKAYLVKMENKIVNFGDIYAFASGAKNIKNRER